MTVKAHTTQQTVVTTTLEIERPQQYALLEERFRLVRYVLPDALRYRQNRTDYGRLHNTIRDQIDYPYKSFQYDELDGKKNKRWVVYVLYPRMATVGEVTLNWFADTPFPGGKYRLATCHCTCSSSCYKSGFSAAKIPSASSARTNVTCMRVLGVLTFITVWRLS